MMKQKRLIIILWIAAILFIPIFHSALKIVLGCHTGMSYFRYERMRHQTGISTDVKDVGKGTPKRHPICNSFNRGMEERAIVLVELGSLFGLFLYVYVQERRKQ